MSKLLAMMLGKKEYYLDFLIVGTLNNNNNVFSGFGVNKVLKSKEYFNYNNFELVLAFRTGSSFGSYEYICNNDVFNLNVYKSGSNLYLRSDKGFQASSSLTIIPNGELLTATNYKVKLNKQNATYLFSYSKNNSDYIDSGSFEYQNNLNRYLFLGGANQTSQSPYFKGSIDFNNSYAIIDGKMHLFRAVSE